MPAPIALSPLLWTALRVGATATLAYYVARRGTGAAADPARDDVLDRVNEGVRVGRGKEIDGYAMHSQARYRRVIRLGTQGPGLEFDATGLGRIKIKRTR